MSKLVIIIKKMKERILLLEDIGYVHMKKRKRSRRISITLKPFKGIQVSVPHSVSYYDAEQFVLNKVDWIRSHLNIIEQVENKATVFDESSQFNTKNHVLRIQKTISPKVSIRIFPGVTEIQYPETISVYSEEIQNAIRTGIEETWRIEAKQYLPNRVGILAARFGFMYNRVTIKNIKSRWGSCSYQNNINLSLHLMRLPDELIDYIILHELVHTIVKNHSQVFWESLERVCANARSLDKQVNQWSLNIY